MGTPTKAKYLDHKLIDFKEKFEMQNDNDISQGMNKVIRTPSETRTHVNNNTRQQNDSDMLRLRELDEPSKEKVQSVELPKQILKRAKQKQQKSSN